MKYLQIDLQRNYILRIYCRIMKRRWIISHVSYKLVWFLSRVILSRVPLRAEIHLEYNIANIVYVNAVNAGIDIPGWPQLYLNART